MAKNTSILLGDYFDNFINQQIKSGKFTSASEVVRTALRMFEYTGVDGIMIGRGAIGNPWIFEQIKYYLENNKKMSAPTNKEKYEIIKEHLELNLKEKGNVVGINEMRKHISAYTKNMPEASRFRDEINHITDVNILMSKIQEFFIDIFDKK